MILTFTHGASKFFNNLDQFLGGDISIFININQVESLKYNCKFFVEIFCL